MAQRMWRVPRRVVWAFLALCVLAGLAAGATVLTRHRSETPSADVRSDGSGAPAPAPGTGNRPGAGTGRMSGYPSPSPVRSNRGNGYPDASNTGVPAGTHLAPMKGEVVIRKDGTVIDGVDLVGSIVVAANNVTIRRSRITSPPNLPNQGRDEFTVVQQYTTVKGLRIEDSEIDGSNLVQRAVMASDGLTVLRCDLRDVGHGVEIGSNYLIQDSWIHDTSDGPDHNWHVDGVISSIGVNGVIRHNTIVLTGGSLTGAVSVGSSIGAIDNVLIQDNLLAGGNYTMYVNTQNFPATRIRVLNNRFSTMVNPKVGVYGIWYPNLLPKDLVRQGNTLYETGKPADDEPDWG